MYSSIALEGRDATNACPFIAPYTTILYYRHLPRQARAVLVHCRLLDKHGWDSLPALQDISEDDSKAARHGRQEEGEASRRRAAVRRRRRRALPSKRKRKHGRERASDAGRVHGSRRASWRKGFSLTASLLFTRGAAHHFDISSVALAYGEPCMCQHITYTYGYATQSKPPAPSNYTAKNRCMALYTDTCCVTAPSRAYTALYTIQLYSNTAEFKNSVQQYSAIHYIQPV